MDLLFTHLSTLIIGVASLVGALWLWSGVKDWFYQYWIFLRKAALIDGPPALPIFGNGLYFIGDVDESLNKWIKLADTYTTSLRVWLGPVLRVVIRDPADIEILIKHPGATYKSIEYKFVEEGTGPGLLTSSGPTHKVHRNLLLPMVNGKVLDTFIDSFETQSQRCVECLESYVDSGEFDIKPFVENCTIDIVLDTIVGVPGTVQQGGHIKLKESFIELNSLAFERMTKVWMYPDCIFRRTRSGKKFYEGVSFARKFFDDIISEKKKKYHDSKDRCDLTDPQRSAFMDQLIAYNEEHELMDEVRLRNEVATLFIAAQEPPTIISSFLLLMLAMHPEIQDKVRAEVQETIGNEIVTMKSISQLKYLEMVIKETMRLFPIGVFLIRKATTDIEFSSCTAPKGSSVTMFLFMTHRDPKFWKEPNKFDPDRFLPENSVGRHPYAFLPFSGGIRGCIGKQYAMMMMKTLVTRIVQKYRLHSNGSLENLRLACNLFTRSLDGCKVSITRL